jgi:hypothetical protein
VFHDRFDGDLYKLLPGSRRLIRGIGAVPLVTTATEPRPGQGLNGATQWNDDAGMVAFYGFDAPERPPGYAAPCAVEVRCTFEGLVRDAWVQGYRAVVGGREIWNAGELRYHLSSLLLEARGTPLAAAWEGDLLRAQALASLATACLAFRGLCEERGVTIPEAPPRAPVKRGGRPPLKAALAFVEVEGGHRVSTEWVDGGEVRAEDPGARVKLMLELNLWPDGYTAFFEAATVGDAKAQALEMLGDLARGVRELRSGRAPADLRNDD